MSGPRFIPGDQGVSDLQPGRDFQQIPVGPRRIRTGRYRALQLAGAPQVEVFSEHSYARLNGSFLTLVPGPSLLVLPSTGIPRNMLILRNAATLANLYVNFGDTASTSSIFRLVPGTIVLFDTVVPQDDVYCFSDDTDGAISIAVSTTANGVRL